MAKVTSPSEAHLSGRLGDKVYSQYYGSTYVCRLPTVKKEARTPAHLLNQQCFREINRFCKGFKPSLIARIRQYAARILELGQKPQITYLVVQKIVQE